MTSAKKYGAIKAAVRKLQLKKSVEALCGTAGVSRCGYYTWQEKKEKHAIREEHDYQDYLLLKTIL